MEQGKNNSKKEPSRKRRRQWGAPPPKPGEKGYKSPTQLRNERKRRAKKRKKEDGDATGSVKGDQQPEGLSTGKGTKEATKDKSVIPRGLDPSSKYLRHPERAPIVKTAKAHFQSIMTDSSAGFQVHQGKNRGWRTVAKLAVRPNEDDLLSVGLFAPHSHQLVPVPNCVAHHPSINKAVACLEYECRKLGVKAYDDSLGAGHLRNVSINVERATGKVQMTLVWNSEPCDLQLKNDDENTNDDSEDKRLLQRLTKSLMAHGKKGKSETVRKRRRGKKGREEQQTKSLKESEGIQHQVTLHSLWIHFNSSWKHANAVFNVDGGSDTWLHVFGPKSITERLELTDFGDAGLSSSSKPMPSSPALYFPPNVFRQANLDQFTEIVRSIRKRMRRLSRPKCLELYGGVGTIGLNVTDLVESLVSSDENPFNKPCFDRSVSDVQSILGTMEAPTMRYESRGATEMTKSSSASDLRDADVVIVDPPRKGLEEGVLRCLMESSSDLQLLVYVSCGFEAFQRDCQGLLSSGWKLEHAEGHLLFPGADAIETLAFFVSTTKENRNLRAK